MIINLYWIKNFYFFLPKRCVDVVQECSIEAEIKILSMLYSSRSIRLQVFCTIAIRKCIRLQWYVAVIARCRVQYGKYFLIFCSLFTSLCASEIIAKYEKRGKYLPILHEAIYDNYFIVKCLFRSNRTKYSRMDQVKFVEDSLYKILFGPFLNTLSHTYEEWSYLLNVSSLPHII